MHINLFFTVSTPKTGRICAFPRFLGDLWESIQFTEDSADKLNYTRAQSSRYFLVFCVLSASETLAHVQPRIASLDLGMSTFLQLRVLGICQHGWICSGTGATPLPAPGARCLSWILPLRFGANKRRVRNLWIANSWGDTRRWARRKVVTLHGSLGWRKQRVNVQQQCWKKSRNLGCSGPYLLRFEVGNKSLMAHKQLLWCLTFKAMLTKHTRVS